MTRSQSARSTPSGWSMKRRSDSPPGCSMATRSSSESSSVSCCWMSAWIGHLVAYSLFRAVKKVGKAHFSTTAIQIGTEKLAASIARRGPVRGEGRCLRGEGGPPLPAAPGDGRLEDPSARGRPPASLAMASDLDAVARPCRRRWSIRVTAFSALSKPIAGSETSLRTIRSAPLRVELGAGPADRVAAVLGGEADDRLAVARGRRRGRRGCPRSAPG